MRFLSAIFCALFLITAFDSHSQTRSTAWYATANGNFYLPVKQLLPKFSWAASGLVQQC
jgi:hypothetical protein